MMDDSFADGATQVDGLLDEATSESSDAEGASHLAKIDKMAAAGIDGSHGYEKPRRGRKKKGLLHLNADHDDLQLGGGPAAGNETVFLGSQEEDEHHFAATVGGSSSSTHATQAQPRRSRRLAEAAVARGKGKTSSTAGAAPAQVGASSSSGDEASAADPPAKAAAAAAAPSSSAGGEGPSANTAECGPCELLKPKKEKDLDFDVSSILKGSEKMKLEEMTRITPSAMKGSQEGLKTMLCTWSEQKVSEWKREKVLKIFLLAIKAPRLWGGNEFAVLVAKEPYMTARDRFHFHIIVHFFARHRQFHKIEKALKKGGHKIKCDVIQPGQGVSSLVIFFFSRCQLSTLSILITIRLIAQIPPLTYVMVYDGKILDEEPHMTPNFVVPNSVRVAAKEAKAKAVRRPMNVYDAQEYLLANPDLFENESKCEMGATVRAQLQEAGEKSMAAIPAIRFMRWLAKTSAKEFVDQLIYTEFMHKAPIFNQPIGDFFTKKEDCV